MTARHLTLKEAQEFTGKSRSTLRRFVEAIVKSGDSPDRQFLLPTVKEVVALKKNNQPFSWRIDEKLLTREFRSEQESEKVRAQSGGVGDGNRIISVLEKTVTVLQEELTEKNKQIAAFQERQRENNLLLKNLQEQLAIAPPARESTIDSEPMVSEKFVSAESSPRNKLKDEPEATKSKKKPTWLKLLFRS